jgi:hypothetical protein
MKPKCLHRFTLSRSVTTDSKRILTMRCSLCGKEKVRRKALGRVRKASSTADPQKKPRSLKTQRKPILKVSERRKVEEKEYSKLRKVFLEENPQCQVEGCKEAATEVHHKGRRGKNYLRVELFMAVCSQHHDKIEKNGLWAKSMGYTIPYHLT